MELKINDYSNYVVDILDKDFQYITLFRANISFGSIGRTYLPGNLQNCEILSAKDLPNNSYIEIKNSKIPLLARRKISYFGEPIFIIIGPSKIAVDSVREKIKVEFIIEENTTNIELSKNITQGNAKTIFEEKKATQDKNNEIDKNQIEKTYFKTAVKKHFFPDIQGACAEITKSEKMNIFVPTEWPKHVAKTVNNLISQENMEILISKHTNSFDGKNWVPSLMASYVALITKLTEKKTKLIFSKKEDSLYYNNRPSSSQTIESVINENEEIEALSYEINLNCGAFAPFGKEMINTAIFILKKFYNFRNLDAKINIVTDFTPACNTLTGMSLTQVFFGIETHINKIAITNSISPIDIRKKNINHNFFKNYYKSLNQNIFKTILDAIEKKTDFNRKFFSYKSIKNSEYLLNKRRGIGLSTVIQPNGIIHQNKNFNCTVKIDILKNNKVKLYTSSISSKQETKNEWIKTISTMLDIPRTDIKLEYSTDFEIPESAPSILSGNLSVIKKLIKFCCKKIKENKKNIGSYKVSTNDLPKNGEDSFYTSYSTAAFVVELYVNSLTQKINISKITSIIECGNIVNKQKATSTLKKYIIQSLIWTLKDQSTEKLLENRQFTYPSLTELPELDINFIENSELDESGIAELAYCGIPSAIASAIMIATNKNIKEIPIIEESLLSEEKISEDRI